MAVHDLPGITVAICTRDRPEPLRRAVRSVLAQRVPAAEILVVDNAPADARTRRLVESELTAVRYVREPVAGLDFARNRALREATQDVVAFLDDDAEADPDWLGAVAAAFARHPAVGVCTGRIEPLALETEAQRLFESNGGLFARRDTRLHLPDDANRSLAWRAAPRVAWAVSAGSGCNLAVRRDAALALGGFDEALDLGAALPGGGDNDLVWRMLEAGHDVVYEPAARVRHEHRREMRAAEEQIVGHQRAMIALLAKSVGTRHSSVPARARNAAFLGWRLLKPGVRLARRAAGRDPLPARVLWRIWGACWRGLWAYPAARRIAAARRAGGASA